MAVPPTEPAVDVVVFWQNFSRLVTRRMKERMHGEITLVLQDGRIRLVRENRSHAPGNLPDG